MGTRKIGPSRQETANDVGTLWLLRKHGRSARCALLDCQGSWALRVVIDHEVVLTERCDRPAESFEIAERWKARMLDKGWLPIVPALRPSA